MQALYAGSFAAGLFLAPAIFFKGGPAQYWDMPLASDTALEWFCNGLGAQLGGLAVMNALATPATVEVCTTVNFLTNAAGSALFYKALSNKDANATMWKIQNIIGLGMLIMSGIQYLK